MQPATETKRLEQRNKQVRRRRHDNVVGLAAHQPSDKLISRGNVTEHHLIILTTALNRRHVTRHVNHFG